MKIAIVTAFPQNPDAPEGGVEAVSVNLVQSLSQLPECEVNVITLDKGITSVVVETRNNYRVHRLPRSDNSELMNALSEGRKTVSAYVESIKPDIIHAHDTYGLMVKDINLPRVFTIHGFIYGDTLVSGTKFPYIRSLIWKYIEISGWKHQPHIISISPYVRERISRYVKGVTIHDIDNPISDIYFHVRNEPSNHRIFSAAAICPRKNTLSLVKAIHELKIRGMDVELRLAGTVTNKEYGDLVTEYIAKNKIGDNVRLLGKLSSSDVISELSKSSIFALLSLEENSPMGIEEAMAVGIPVVTSNLCGMPYMVKNYESGYLVNPNNIKEIAEKINNVLSSAELRQSMAKKGRDIAFERFHSDKVALQTKRVYEDCILTFGQ